MSWLVPSLTLEMDPTLFGRLESAAKMTLNSPQIMQIYRHGGIPRTVVSL